MFRNAERSAVFFLLSPRRRSTVGYYRTNNSRFSYRHFNIDEANMPMELWLLRRMVLVSVEKIEGGYGGRLRLRGRIEGAQSERAAISGAPARVTGSPPPT